MMRTNSVKIHQEKLQSIQGVREKLLQLKMLILPCFITIFQLSVFFLSCWKVYGKSLYYKNHGSLNNNRKLEAHHQENEPIKGFKSEALFSEIYVNNTGQDTSMTLASAAAFNNNRFRNVNLQKKTSELINTFRIWNRRKDESTKRNTTKRRTTRGICSVNLCGICANVISHLDDQCTYTAEVPSIERILLIYTTTVENKLAFRSDSVNSVLSNTGQTLPEAVFNVKEHKGLSDPVLLNAGGVQCSALYCGSCQNVSSAGGIIQSPNYPDDYGDDQDCFITINAPPGYKIRIKFNSFNVEECCDHLSIHDGTSRVVIQLQGYIIPSTIITKTNKVFIRFTSDFSNTLLLGQGRWQAMFTVEPPETTTSFENESTTGLPKTTTPAELQSTSVSETPTTVETSSEIKTITASESTSPFTTEYSTITEKLTTTAAALNSKCNLTPRDVCMITSNGGVIQSPNYPNEYGNNINSNFTIEVSSGSIIQLNFTKFVVEEKDDFIQVYDGITEKVATNLTGYNIPTIVTSTSNKLTITFQSNLNNNNIPVILQPGRWQATFTVLKSTTPTQQNENSTPYLSTIPATTSTTKAITNPIQTTTSEATTSSAPATSTETISITPDPTTTEAATTKKDTTTATSPKTTTTSPAKTSPSDATTSKETTITEAITTVEATTSVPTTITTEAITTTYNTLPNSTPVQTTSDETKISTAATTSFQEAATTEELTTSEETTTSEEATTSSAATTTEDTTTTEETTITDETTTTEEATTSNAAATEDPTTTKETTTKEEATTSSASTNTEATTNTEETTTTEETTITDETTITEEKTTSEQTTTTGGETTTTAATTTEETTTPNAATTTEETTTTEVETTSTLTTTTDETTTTEEATTSTSTATTEETTTTEEATTSSAVTSSSPETTTRKESTTYTAATTFTTETTTLEGITSTSKTTSTPETTSTQTATTTKEITTSTAATTSTSKTTTFTPATSSTREATTTEGTTASPIATASFTPEETTIETTTTTNSAVTSTPTPKTQVTTSTSTQTITTTSNPATTMFTRPSTIFTHSPTSLNPTTTSTQSTTTTSRRATTSAAITTSTLATAITSTQRIPSTPLPTSPTTSVDSKLKCDVINMNSIQLDNGRCTNVTSSGGVVLSPNFPNDYGNNRNIIYTITVPPTSKVFLVFKTFIVEEKYDYIYVFDGDSTISVSNFTGYVIPASVTSTTNRMKIVFRSDHFTVFIPSKYGRGRWEATFTMV